MRSKRLTSEELTLRKMADELRKKYGCLGMKISTEDMGESFEWINLVANKILADTLPVYVKIGGPNARGDIKQAYRLGVAGILAPMVESPYALKDYIQALRTIIPRNVLDNMLRGVNAETITCYEKFDDMLKIPEIKELNHISVARGDLSKSIRKSMDDPETLRISKEMVEKVKKTGIPVSVSTSTPNSARLVAETIKPDKVNAAHVYISVHEVSDVYEAFKKGLLFENALMKYKYTRAMEEASLYKNIIEARKSRMEGKDVPLH